MMRFSVRCYWRNLVQDSFFALEGFIGSSRERFCTMDASILVLFFLIFLAGFIDSIAGGGGLITVPAYMAVGLPAHMALGTNKFSSVMGLATSTYRFIKNKHVHWRSAAAAFIGALFGSRMGANLVLTLDERTVRYIVLVLVPIVLVFMVLRKDIGINPNPVPNNRVLPYSVLIGLVIGMYDGFFGPGAGTFLIIAFTAIIGLEMITACGNAKIVNLASNIAAVVTFIQNDSVMFIIGIPCAICSIAGNYIGSGLTMSKGAKLVRPMMFVVIGLLLARIAWDLIAS